jgi:hypothetical protein
MMPSMPRFMAILGGCVFGLGLSGILYSIPALQDAGPPLLISSGAVGLGVGLIVAAFVKRD